ncbi:uncharacterized protein L969DRAFT_18850 [Mixia osmundae IAM 14324]|uniref:Mitotic checkpoint regulator, MAD2B-interacting-domain-containing protein n=1 Tax=Mixia osmundae (strain CBS 9802 / IAM 14324 / JCM 22182 / KY 12970) TaxID=764103 RepID=G7DX32_MIXOS|nr:uncharacterized protein L969DRAFT_18850 [Mixia osmundae IAM 14324]KEI38063.1 hypothetical protein L969DRAFT_18850 [Mixia osmundae IAM 14324]GAA95129.1 hypothetical protein E5Q_01784 [Mixia osmundae IAM 14324]
MAGLVSYGSDSDDSDHEQPAPPPVNAPAASSTAPKQDMPLPKSKRKGPVKIMLDLPDPSSPAKEEPAPKRAKLDFGRLSGKSGLASMLPAPKASTTQSVATPSASTARPVGSLIDAPEGDESGVAALDEIAQPEPAAAAATTTTSFVPHKVKSKLPPPKPAAPVVDFFSLGAAEAVRTTTESVEATRATAIKAAPVLEDKPVPNYYATLPPPSATDPYPGFYLKKDGKTWAAKEPEAWLEWSRMNGWVEADQSSSATPKEFDTTDEDVSEVKADDALIQARLEKARKKLLNPHKEEKPKEEQQAQPKRGMHRARERGQLTALLAEAVDNREALEERIAQAKATKRSSGSRYGF